MYKNIVYKPMMYNINIFFNRKLIDNNL